MTTAIKQIFYRKSYNWIILSRFQINDRQLVPHVFIIAYGKRLKATIIAFGLEWLCRVRCRIWPKAYLVSERYSAKRYKHIRRMS